MSTDSQGLYASLKVLVSAITTDTHLANSLQLTRGYQVCSCLHIELVFYFDKIQMLAILLEEKSNLVNSHILHMVGSIHIPSSLNINVPLS
jgi:hypothetical protein